MSTKTPANPFAVLTWDDIDAWAGSTIVSRGKSYQRGRQVQNLARTASGGILAWVQGSERYATQVEIDNKKLTASCTCPYDYGPTCKHAVAVVLAYLEVLKTKSAIPKAAEDDPRFDLLQNAGEAGDEDEYEEDEDENHDEDEDEDNDDEEGEDDDDDEAPVRPRAVSKRAQPAAADGATTYLEQQSKEELFALLKDLMRQQPDVREAIVDRANLLSGTAKKLVATARKEIRALAKEPSWRDDDDWRRGGSGDYPRIRTHLEALLAAGHADEVLSLGQELLEAGAQVVEMGDEDGEVAGEVIETLNIVFRALPQSSLTPIEQMLWAIDAELKDEYDLCQGTAEFWAQASYEASDWSAVADQLDARLRKLSREKGGDEFLSTHRRDQLSNRLIRALEDAGRQDEIIPLCAREAEETNSYMRLVERLKHAQRWEEMEQWLVKGIAATHQQSPGITSRLRSALRERREQQKQWPQVAAFYAEDFFDRPDAASLRELLKAAKHAGVEAAVRAGAFHYLETGTLPWTLKPTKKTGDLPAWPLPACEVKETGARRVATPPPMRQALIDIAIDEKRPDEVLRWYDAPAPSPTPAWAYQGWGNEDRIATAVASAYPDRAITIWKKMAEDQIEQVQVSAYETAATYLRKVHGTYKKHDREQEWKEYLAFLRQTNLRRPRLVQILDGLTGKRIVEM